MTTEYNIYDEPIPEWQIDLGKTELENIENGDIELLEWKIAKEYLIP